MLTNGFQTKHWRKHDTVTYTGSKLGFAKDTDSILTKADSLKFNKLRWSVRLYIGDKGGGKKPTGNINAGKIQDT